MVLGYNYSKKSGGGKRMHLICPPFWWLRWCFGAIQMALPNTACPGLLRKPLDIGIGWLLALYCSSGPQGNRQTNNNKKMIHIPWPCWWPWQCAGTIPCTLPYRGGSVLQRKPLVAATGRVLRSIVGNETKKHRVFQVFIVDPLKRGLRWCQGL